MLFKKDFIAGVIFSTIGLAAALISTEYRMGSLTRMGPGYFPLILGTVICLLGLTLVIRSIARPSISDNIGELGVRPTIFIILAILFFGSLINTWGMVPALTALIILSWAAGSKFSLMELGGLLVVLNTIAILIFIVGLGVPLRIFMW